MERRAVNLVTLGKAQPHFRVLRAVERISDLQGATSSQEAIQTFQAIIESFGCDAFSAGIVESAGFRSDQPVFVSTWPKDWSAHWLQQRYWRVDPVVSGVMEQREPFFWAEALERATPTGRKVFAQARTFGLDDGFSVPSHNADLTISTVTVVGKRLDWSPEEQSCMHLLCLYFLGVLRKFLRPLTEKRDFQLSDRERECLHWVAGGKDDPAIATILSISENTVKFHMKNILRKMNCTTRAQAVVEAIRHGQIAP